MDENSISGRAYECDVLTNFFHQKYYLIFSGVGKSSDSKAGSSSSTSNTSNLNSHHSSILVGLKANSIKNPISI
jgi:hypothetical protein